MLFESSSSSSSSSCVCLALELDNQRWCMVLFLIKLEMCSCFNLLLDFLYLSVSGLALWPIWFLLQIDRGEESVNLHFVPLFLTCTHLFLLLLEGELLLLDNLQLVTEVELGRLLLQFGELVLVFGDLLQRRLHAAGGNLGERRMQGWIYRAILTIYRADRWLERWVRRSRKSRTGNGLMAEIRKGVLYRVTNMVNQNRSRWGTQETLNKIKRNIEST